MKVHYKLNDCGLDFSGSEEYLNYNKHDGFFISDKEDCESTQTLFEDDPDKDNLLKSRNKKLFDLMYIKEEKSIDN